MNGFFITGTDTDVGKTVAAAWGCLQLEATYWKPIQSGLADGLSDTDVVHKLTEKSASDFLKSRYSLTEPLSPHEAARLDGVRISLDDFWLPQTEKPLILEGAGGVMVPINEKALMLDLMHHLGLPVIVVARSTLGTINHTLLTLAALRQAQLPIVGVILSGPENEANKLAIETYGNVPILGFLPPLSPLNKQALLDVSPLIATNQWTPLPHDK